MAPNGSQAEGSSDGAGGLSWKGFLDGGSKGVKEAVVLDEGRRVKLCWVDGHESEFSLVWLRDNSDGSFHPTTKQREVDTFSVSGEARVKYASVETASPSPSSNDGPSNDADESIQAVLRLRWDAAGDKSGDEEECTVSIARLRQHCTSETARTLRRQLGASVCAETPDPTPVLWGKGVLSSSDAGDSPLRFEYEAIMDPSQTAASRLRGALKSHGLALVRGVPTELAATEEVGLKVTGHLMGTLFGKTVWDITNDPADSDTLFVDSALSTDGLPLHTDYPYGTETPGLQVFSCLKPAVEGGGSTYADGFAVAERLRKEHPDAFEFFTKTSISYQFLEDGYHLIAEGPVLRTDPHGVMLQVRFNDSYRTPLDYLSADDIDRFYEHHRSLIATTRDPSMVERIRLEKGDTMLFNNHRIMHGREPYKGSRHMAGCYIGKDDADSEARLRGFSL